MWLSVSNEVCCRCVHVNCDFSFWHFFWKIGSSLIVKWNGAKTYAANFSAVVWKRIKNEFAVDLIRTNDLSVLLNFSHPSRDVFPTNFTVVGFNWCHSLLNLMIIDIDSMVARLLTFRRKSVIYFPADNLSMALHCLISTCRRDSHLKQITTERITREHLICCLFIRQRIPVNSTQKNSARQEKTHTFWPNLFLSNFSSAG